MSLDVFDGLRSYQIQEVLRAPEPRWGIYADPRMGKTRIITRSAMRWVRELGVQKLLVIGPLTPLQVTWMRELRAVGFATPREGGGPLGYIVPLLSRVDTGGRTKSVVSVFRELEEGAAQGRPVVVLLNDEMLRREYEGPRGGLHSITELLIRWEPDMLVRDEVHRDKNAGSQRSMALRRLSRYSKGVRVLTGTPDPNGYMDLYAQFCVLDPSVFGTNKAKFQERYCISSWPGIQVIGYQNVDELLAKVRSRASIIRASDYFDTPPVEEVKERLELPPGARTRYEALYHDSVLCDDQLGVNIDATHKLTKIMRLQQLAAGYLPVAEPERDPVVWVHDVKVKACVDLAAEPLNSGQKIVVSFWHRPEGEKIAAALRKRYGERVVHELNGNTPARDREKLIAPFSIDEDVTSDARIMVVQEKTGGVGISLGRADHLIFATWSFDFGDVAQMKKRIWHEDKKRMTETFLVMKNTADVFALATVRKKANASLMASSVNLHAAAFGYFDEAA